MALKKTALERQKEAQEEEHLTQRLFNGSLLDGSRSQDGSSIDGASMLSITNLLASASRTDHHDRKPVGFGLRADTTFVQTLDLQISRSLTKVNEVMDRLEEIQRQRDAVLKRVRPDKEETRQEAEMVMMERKMWDANGNMILSLVNRRGSGLSDANSHRSDDSDGPDPDWEDSLELYPLHRRRNALWGDRTTHFGTLCAPPKEPVAIVDAELFPRGDLGSLPNTAEGGGDRSRLRGPLGRRQGGRRGPSGEILEDGEEGEGEGEEAEDFDEALLAAPDGRVLRWINHGRNGSIQPRSRAGSTLMMRSRGGDGEGALDLNGSNFFLTLPDGGYTFGPNGPGPNSAFVAMLGAKPGPGKGVWGNLGASGTDLNASATAPLPGAADGARGGPAADAGKAAGAGAAGTKPYVPIDRSFFADPNDPNTAKSPPGSPGTAKGKRAKEVKGEKDPKEPKAGKSPTGKKGKGKPPSPGKGGKSEKGRFGGSRAGSPLAVGPDDVEIRVGGSGDEDAPSPDGVRRSTLKGRTPTVDDVLGKLSATAGGRSRSRGGSSRSGAGSPGASTPRRWGFTEEELGQLSAVDLLKMSQDPNKSPEERARLLALAHAKGLRNEPGFENVPLPSLKEVMDEWEANTSEGWTPKNHAWPAGTTFADALIEALRKLAEAHPELSHHIHIVLGLHTDIVGRVARLLASDPEMFMRLPAQVELVKCLLSIKPTERLAGRLLLHALTNHAAAAVLARASLLHESMGLLRLVDLFLEQPQLDVTEVTDKAVQLHQKQPSLLEAILQVVSRVPNVDVQLLLQLADTHPDALLQLLYVLTSCPEAHVQHLAKLLAQEGGLDIGRLVSLLKGNPGKGFEKELSYSSELAYGMAGKLLALLSVNTNWNINVLRNLISVCPHLDYERLASMLSNSEEVTLDKLLAFFQTNPNVDPNRILELAEQHKGLSLEAAAQLACLDPAVLAQLQKANPGLDLNVMAMALAGNPLLEAQFERLANADPAEVAALSNVSAAIMKRLADQPDMDMATASSLMAAALMGEKDPALTGKVISMLQKDPRLVSQMADLLGCSAEEILAQLNKKDISAIGALIEEIAQREGNYLEGFSRMQGEVIHESSAKLMAEMGVASAATLQNMSIDELMHMYNDAVDSLRALKMADAMRTRATVNYGSCPMSHAERMELIKALMVSVQTKPSWSSDPALIEGFEGIVGSGIGKTSGSSTAKPRKKGSSLRAKLATGCSLAAALRMMASAPEEGLIGLPGRGMGDSDGSFLPKIGGKAVLAVPKQRNSPSSQLRTPPLPPPSATAGEPRPGPGYRSNVVIASIAPRKGDRLMPPLSPGKGWASDHGAFTFSAAAEIR